MAGPIITHERLKELLNYDPETGYFTWKVRRYGIRLGAKAGWTRYDKRIHIGLDGRDYQAHRLAWLYMAGEWPSEIDHIDCNPSNNRWSNLRIATRSQNLSNRKIPKNKLKGAFPVTRSRKWRAQIVKDYKTIYLGIFSTELEAHEAYMKAAREIYGEFARAEQSAVASEPAAHEE